MNRYIKILENIGIPQHAGAIYIALLEGGSSNMSEISEHTGLQRIQIYRNLPILLEKGLIFVIKKGKRKIYSPANPEVLKNEYERLQKNTFDSLDQMSKKYKTSQNKTNVIFGKGKKAITNTFHDLLATLNNGEIFYRISSEVDSKALFDKYHPKNYRRIRDQKGIERIMIYSDHAAAQKKVKLEREMKSIDSKIMKFDDNIMFTIYGDKLSLIDFNKETSIIIESAELARFQEKVFKLLFKKL